MMTTSDSSPPVRPGQIWREKDNRYDREVTVVGVAEPFVWVVGNVFKRRTRSRIARFVKAFTLIFDPGINDV